MNSFLSCDWGSSSLRLRLVEAPALRVAGEVRSDEGIAVTNQRFRESAADPKDRFAFFQSVITSHLTRLGENTAMNLAGIPLVLSGMASSRIGMEELPYATLPLRLSGEGLVTRLYDPSNSFPHPLCLVSGVCGERDVMRGEEIQLAGCEISATQQTICVLPGTHSKHVRVDGGAIVEITTFMTGEFFVLLARKSMLAVSVDETGESEPGGQTQAFREGVEDSMLHNLLHAAFLVRTNDLFGRFSRRDNTFYLSGLLIGHELNVLRDAGATKLLLISDQRLRSYYEPAARIVGIHHRLHFRDADEALIRGHYEIARRTWQVS